MSAQIVFVHAFKKLQYYDFPKQTAEMGLLFSFLIFFAFFLLHFYLLGGIIFQV